jgi:hypothetical protein
LSKAPAPLSFITSIQPAQIDEEDVPTHLRKTPVKAPPSPFGEPEGWYVVISSPSKL